MKHRIARKPTYRPTMDDFKPQNSQQLSCKEAGQFDHTHGLREKLTGWGAICKARAKKTQPRPAAEA